ncbi:MAG TPA: hypothetical protein VGI92_13645 [Gemmatimonadales bacterium]|jgi:hypothetical protein
MDGELIPHESPKSSWLEKTFFTPLYHPSGALEVIKWWESRRVTYNAWVGTAGMLTIAAALLTGGGGPPVGIPIVYALAANVFYSFGAPADLLLRRWLGHRGGAVGPVLFRYGFVGSVALTLLPIPILIFGKIMGAIFG